MNRKFCALQKHREEVKSHFDFYFNYFITYNLGQNCWDNFSQLIKFVHCAYIWAPTPPLPPFNVVLGPLCSVRSRILNIVKGERGRTFLLKKFAVIWKKAWFPSLSQQVLSKIVGILTGISRFVLLIFVMNLLSYKKYNTLQLFANLKRKFHDYLGFELEQFGSSSPLYQMSYILLRYLERAVCLFNTKISVVSQWPLICFNINW